MEDVSVKPPAGPAYLGDGVYASFDGYQIWLHVGAHDSHRVVALDHRTYQSLAEYAQRVFP